MIGIVFGYYNINLNTMFYSNISLQNFLNCAIILIVNDGESFGIPLFESTKNGRQLTQKMGDRLIIHKREKLVNPKKEKKA